MAFTSLQRANEVTSRDTNRLVRDTACTATASVGLITVAAIHWSQVVPTTQDTPYLGVGFMLLSVACVVIAASLLVTDRAGVWVSVAVVNALAVAGYVFTRTVSSSFDAEDVGNWSEALGMVALLVETLLIALSLYRLREKRALSGSNYQRSDA